MTAKHTFLHKGGFLRKDEFVKRSIEAIRKAAIDAREKAIETGTGIVIVKRGHVVKVSAETLQKKKSKKDYGVRVKRTRGQAKAHRLSLDS